MKIYHLNVPKNAREARVEWKHSEVSVEGNTYHSAMPFAVRWTRKQEHVSIATPAEVVGLVSFEAYSIVPSGEHQVYVEYASGEAMYVWVDRAVLFGKGMVRLISTEHGVWHERRKSTVVVHSFDLEKEESV